MNLFCMRKRTKTDESEGEKSFEYVYNLNSILYILKCIRGWMTNQELVMKVMKVELSIRTM